MTDVQTRLLNLAQCCADAGAQGASVIDPDTDMLIVVTVMRASDHKEVAEAVASSGYYTQWQEPEPIASRKAPRDWNGELIVDEYSPAHLYEQADTLVKKRKEAA